MTNAPIKYRQGQPSRLYSFINSDGILAIMRVLGNASLEAILEKMNSRPGAVPVHKEDLTSIREDAIPADRTFRDAWKLDKGKIQVNMEKAKVIHMDYLRQQRNKKLQVLDTEVLKNINNPERLAEIEAEKQVLRDIPQTLSLDAAATPERLKSTTHPALQDFSQ